MGAKENKTIKLFLDDKFLDSCKSFTESKNSINQTNFQNELNKIEIINLLKKYIVIFPILIIVILFIVLKYSKDDK